MLFWEPSLWCLFGGCWFLLLVFEGFEGQVRWPEGPPHLARWPEGPPHLALSLILSVFFFEVLRVRWGGLGAKPSAFLFVLLFMLFRFLEKNLFPLPPQKKTQYFCFFAQCLACFLLSHFSPPLLTSFFSVFLSCFLSSALLFHPLFCCFLPFSCPLLFSCFLLFCLSFVCF